MNEQRDYTLGLDLGPNSIGWALVATEFDERGEPLDHSGFLDCSAAGHPPMGVRVFEEGIANLGTSKEKPRAQERRVNRSARRIHARRSARKRRLREVLTEAGFLPASEEGFQALMAQSNPYEVRARGLDEALTADEVGRALFHLCQRRGFKSNRKSGSSKDDRGMLKEIADLQASIDDSGARTLGEFLHRMAQAEAEQLQSGDLRLRDRHTRRSMIEHELSLLLEAQRPYHPGLVAIEGKVSHAILHQHDFLVTEERRAKAPSRANLHRSPTVRACLLEPDERCAPRSAWAFQQFRLLKEVHNLRTLDADGEWRELTASERDAALEHLAVTRKVTFKALKKKLGLEADSRLNLEEGGRGHLDGNATDALLASVVGKKAWGGLEDGERRRLRHALEHEEDEERLLAAFSGHDLDEKGRAKLLDYEPADAHGSLSIKALERLLPLMYEGRSEYEAIQAAYPDQQSVGQQPKLPALVEQQKLPRELHDLTNPIVRRALTEVRKVVNAIVREHGLPRQIVVELAREMKQSKKQRDETSKRNRAREKAREAAADSSVEYGGTRGREDVLRVMLWKEQGHVCPYTGRSISQSALFNGETDIDHILPRWMSGDDSQMNKVLVYRDANREKGNKTPAQWLGKDSDAFHELIHRATERCEAGHMPWSKLDRLRQDSVDAEGFVARQLNDTRYISRQAVRFLELLYPAELRRNEKAVRTTRGGLTAELRRNWGLNGVYDPFLGKDGTPCRSAGGEVKQRSDHRHHAVDALVVALSSRANIKRYQDAGRRRHEYEREADQSRVAVEPPWPTLRDDAANAAAEIVVSHRIQAAFQGAFHEATYHGVIRNWGGLEQEGVFVTSTRVADITKKKHLEAVRDHGTRRVLEKHLRAAGWDGTAAELPKDWSEGGVRRPNGRRIKKVRTLSKMKAPVDLGHRRAVGGNNHRVDVIADPDKPSKWLARTVPMLEAVQQAQAQGGGGSNEENLLLRLHRKQSVLVSHPTTGDDVVAVVQKFSGASDYGTGIDICLRDARDSRSSTEANKDPLFRLKSTGALQASRLRTVKVDPLGRSDS